MKTAKSMLIDKLKKKYLRIILIGSVKKHHLCRCAKYFNTTFIPYRLAWCNLEIVHWRNSWGLFICPEISLVCRESSFESFKK